MCKSQGLGSNSHIFGYCPHVQQTKLVVLWEESCQYFNMEQHSFLYLILITKVFVSISWQAIMKKILKLETNQKYEEITNFCPIF